MDTMAALNPLGLAHALPYLPLAQSALDQQVDRRSPHLWDELLADSRTQVAFVAGEFLAVPRGQCTVAHMSEGRMRLALVPLQYVAELLPHTKQSDYEGDGNAQRGIHAIFCGVDSAGVAYVTLDITQAVHIERTGASYGGHSIEAHLQCSEDVAESSQRVVHLLQAIGLRYDWVSLRALAPRVSARDAGIATCSVTLAAWHSRQQYCPYDGLPVEVQHGGWVQSCGTHTLFPRIEPAVIVAVVDSKQRILLQHNTAWREGFYSVSAGFVEAGENLEHAARRETAEETGIAVGELRYIGSQPWPFPSSLMVAFIAAATSTEIHVDGSETAEARWFSRDELLAAVLSGEVELPGKAAIARYMIEQWYGSELPTQA